MYSLERKQEEYNRLANQLNTVTMDLERLLNKCNTLRQELSDYSYDGDLGEDDETDSLEEDSVATLTFVDNKNNLIRDLQAVKRAKERHRCMASLLSMNEHWRN